MSDRKSGILNNRLSSHTSLFGLRLLVLIGISVGVAIVIFLFFISLWLNSKHNKNSGKNKKPKSSSVSNISKEIQEIRIDPPKTLQVLRFPEPLLESEAITQTDDQTIVYESKQGIKYGSNRIYAEIGKDKRFLCSERMESRRLKDLMAVPDVSHLDWGHWYALKEIEESTNGFACENVIGEGGYGIVYYGILGDGTQIAVKNLLNNRGQVEKEFKVEVEAIGRVRHKNLVRLLGYCAENDQKMLVYEYLDNGNLEKWLHGDIATISPLTWEIRMNIILGTAKGLAYLHDGLEPKVVHRDIKSSNILLDKQWNPKVSDFGLAKLLGSERSYVTTRVMGTFGYVAPEYASTGMLNERSDVYSFGILIMEIISGRNPVDYSRPPGEVNLVEWLKKMVANQNAEGLLDPKISEKPSPRALKRVLLVALRCVNPDAKKRPTMGNVVHMLEDSDVQGQEDLRAGCDRIRSNRASPIVGVPMERRISVDKAYYIASPPVNI